MDDTGARTTGRLAVVVGAIAIASAVLLGIYFAVGGPFGPINDVGNATVGVLSAVLAWRLRWLLAGRTGTLAVGAAVAGAAITVLGSALVLSAVTGFFFSGLVSSLGFAGIGAWLVLFVRRSSRAAAWSRALRTSGWLAGGLMALGILVLPGIALRLDDLATAPGWIWIGELGWLGVYVGYPLWAIWYGLTEARRAGRALSAETGDGRAEIRT